MLSFCMGTAAFALYLFYDLNSFLWQRKVPRTFFMAGTLLLAAAVVTDITTACRAKAFAGLGDILLLAIAFLGFAALMYSLFFALPFDKTYTEQQNGRRVYDRGVYALCRHPGILCFFWMYAALGLAALPHSQVLFNGTVFSLLNLAYAWFQDRITFPKTFINYPEYQQTTPFLIPTKASIRTACELFTGAADKEEQP